MAIATGPKPQAIILLPDNGRRGARPTTVEVGLDGCQRGIVRLYTTEEVNGQRVPDYTLVLSREEERRHRRDRLGGPYLFHGEFIDPKAEDEPSS
jgi:hypothetical protein